MILSHRNKFIFLKTSKTAGSSIEAFLRQFCEPGDIITPLLTPGEEEEIQSTGICGPMGDTEIRGTVPLADQEKIKLGDQKAIRRFCVVSHSPAIRVKQYVGESIWDSYFKFCVVRHPLERTMSQYFWKAHTKGWHDARTDFTKRFDFFLASKQFHQLIRKGTGVYLHNGKVMVDYIGKYENLTESLGHAMSRVGVDLKPIELPQLKSGFRPMDDFTDRLLPRQKKVIEKAFEFEFNNFGYKLYG